MMKISRILNNINPTHPIGVSVIIFSSVLLSLIYTLALIMRPLADDYAYFSDPLIGNPFKFAMHYYIDWTGRSGQAMWVSVLYRIFGNHVVNYGTIVQHTLLVLSAVFLAFCILHKRNIPKTLVISIGMVSSVIFVYMTPSIFDTNLWITSSSVYIGSIIAGLISTGYLILIYRINTLQWWHVLIAALITFLAQLFSEPTSMIMIYGFFMSAVVALFVYKNNKMSRLMMVNSIASASGFMYMYLSPGTRMRQHVTGIETELPQVFSGAFADLSKLSYIFSSYRLLLIALLSFLLLLIIPLLKPSRKTTIIISLASFISAFIIPYLLFISTRYTMGAYAPLRAFTVPVAVSSILLAIGSAYVIAYLFSHFNPSRTQWALSLLITVFMPLCFISVIKTEATTIHAVTIRTDMYDARDNYIGQQLRQGSKELNITPLPILTANSDAVDFYYDRTPPAWFEDGFRKFYHLPSSVTISYNQQPQGYCTEHNNPGWLGAKPCTLLNAGE